MGQAFARLGTGVTLIESDDRVLTKEEPEASQVMAEVFAEDGIDVRTGGRVGKVETVGGAVRVHIDDGEPVDVDRVLVATGRTPSTSGMGLEEIGMGLDDRGFIRTDDTMAAPTTRWPRRSPASGPSATWPVSSSSPMPQTACDGGRPQRPLALGQGAKAALRRREGPVGHVHLAGGRQGRHDRGGGRRPRGTDGVPADDRGRPAVASGQTRGFIKLIAGPRPVLRGAGGGRLLGATAVAPVGGKLVHEVALAMRTNMFTGRLAQTVHTYPTWSMAVQKAAAQFFFEIDGREARPARR